jgi:hypothetical protein
MKHQTKTKNQTKPSHRPKMSDRRSKSLRKPAAKAASLKPSKRRPPIFHKSRGTQMPIETVLGQREVVRAAQVSSSKQTVGLDDDHARMHRIPSFLQPGHNLVFGCGAITIEGFEFVHRCVERSFDNINALLQCRTPEDVVAAQSNWVKGHLQDVNRGIHRVAEILQEQDTWAAALDYICARLKSRIGMEFIYKSGERGYH